MLTAPVSIILSVTEGELLTGSHSKVANDIVVDSRHAAPGCVYVAFVGERADGHDFCTKAIEAGARVLLVSRAADELAETLAAARARDVAVIRVDDALHAVQELAAYHRSRLHCAVVGVTGSTGKTTTKDFLDAVLSTALRVVSTEGNRNNELGVPLTILRAGTETDVLVVEMGMRGVGQIARLAQIARPTLALITNVGTSHIEILGSEEAVVRAKGELVEALSSEDAAFLNGDDAHCDEIASLSAAPVTRYGLSEHCEVRAENIELDAESHASFDLVSATGRVRVGLPIPGRHNVYNALSAAAVALHLGVDQHLVAKGLEYVSVTAMRMQVFVSASGVTVVNDAYNANPVSMKAAIDTLADMSTEGSRVAVLGDMAELGSLTELAHFRIGEQVARLPIDVLVTIGERARRIGEGAHAAGMPAESVHRCATVDEAVETLGNLLRAGDTVLVKASRVMGLEAVVEGIVNPL